MLSVLIWVPFLGALLIAVLPESLAVNRARQIALAVTSFVGLWTIYVASQFDIGVAGMQFQESIPWIDSLGLTYQLGVDGLSMPLILINSLLTWIAIYSSDLNISRPRLYYILLLTLGGAVAGAFVAQNILLFFLPYAYSRKSAQTLDRSFLWIRILGCQNVVHSAGRRRRRHT